jgi:hypothetical protein
MSSQPIPPELVATLQEHANRFQRQLTVLRDTLEGPLEGGHMAAVLPVGKTPTARVSRYRVTQAESVRDGLRVVLDGHPERVCPPGLYTRLLVRQVPQERLDSPWVVMMSDTPYEMRTSRGLARNAHGDVLIVGLGLGATTLPLCVKPEVKSITVIEKNLDIIKLVAPHLQEQPGGEKLTIFHDDGHTWQPFKPQKFDTIWLDIWPSVSLSNLPEMATLREKYRPLLRRSKKAWLGVWEETYLLQRKQEFDEHQATVTGTVGGDPLRQLHCSDPEGEYILMDNQKVRL